MSATSLILFALIAAQQPTGPAPRYGELVSQRVQGIRRICVYNNPQAAPPPQERLRQRAIGLAEPCPHRDPGPPPPQRAQIPAMATLTGQRLQGGRKLCVYTYLRLEYGRSIPVDRSCPLTPHFFE